mgnify:CR=1 FL=1
MQATVPSSPIVPALPPRPSNKKFLPDSTIPPLLPPRPASSAPPLPSRPSRVDDLQGKEKANEKEKEKNKAGPQYSSDEIRTRIPPLPPRPNGSGIHDQTPPPLPPHSPVPPLPPRPQQDGILLDLSFDEDSEEKKQENYRYLSILIEALKPSAASPVVSDRENQPGEEEQQADQQPLTPTTDEKEDEDEDEDS